MGNSESIKVAIVRRSKALHTHITYATFGAWHRPCPQFRGKRVSFSMTSTLPVQQTSSLCAGEPSSFSCPPSCPENGQKPNRLSLSPLLKLQSHNLSRTGLEKSAAIRPFATKKSRLASEKNLLADSLATKLFFQSGQRRCGPNVIAQGPWQTSLSVQDARELAVRAPSIVFASKSTPGV